MLPRLLEEILSTRIMVKKAMKKLAPSQKVLQRVCYASKLPQSDSAQKRSLRLSACSDLIWTSVITLHAYLKYSLLVQNCFNSWNLSITLLSVQVKRECLYLQLI